MTLSQHLSAVGLLPQAPFLVIATTSTSDITNSSRFLELPPELRIHIYEKSLIDTKPIATHSERRIMLPPGPGEPIWRAPALLQTCRQVRSEAFNIYYALNTFTIDCSEREDAMLPALQWLRALDVESRRALTCVRFTGRCFSIGDEQSPEGNDGFEDEYSEEIKGVIERRMATLSIAGLGLKPGTLHVKCWLLWAVDWVHQPTWLSRWANELNVDLARMKHDLMAGRSYDQVVLDHYAEERRRAGGRLDGDPPEALP
ncbi:hypothetical protein LTR56_019938 [Elasticomyces elasticus]|nr:hypothetical protein LTR56_019938 [Elasticomyces elasticus]KAK3643375.1 hypothetical protein LTR22_015678 [Elasticomyces elasticus]KAK4914003.1 hypothetical protein LTR49_017717 [Elasticomyces elasticus]KAK5755486.1 hypothetical protein LTS12_014471 [Elasticomyces elasticus]